MTLQMTPDDLEKALAETREAIGAGNIFALNDALILCWRHQRPTPFWLNAAVFDLIDRSAQEAKKEGRQGRHSRWFVQYKQDMIDLVRHDFVLDYREREEAGQQTPWTDVWHQVSDALYEAPFFWARHDAIEKTYKRVKKRMKSEPGRYFMSEAVRTQIGNYLLRQLA